MRLTLDRKYKKETYTIGNLYVDGVWECNVLEDKDRNLTQFDSLDHIRAVKVPGETAIPCGQYRVQMNVVSPKYSADPWYMEVCGGRVPRLADVPGFEGILIHVGNIPLHTKGCLLVGINREKGKVLDSRATFKKLYAKMKAAADRGEDILIDIY